MTDTEGTPMTDDRTASDALTDAVGHYYGSDSWKAARLAVFRRHLLDAAGLDDGDLPADLEPLLEWIVGWDAPTVAGIGRLLQLARTAGTP